MMGWFMGLEPREQRLVLGGGAMVVLLLAYALIWEPLTSAVDDMSAAVSAQRTTLAEMRRAAVEARALQGAGAAGAAGLGGRSVLAVVDQSARAGGLGDALRRVEPEGEDGVRVWLENADFDAMVGWLAGIKERFGIAVSSVSVERQSPGRVSARLKLQGPAA